MNEKKPCDFCKGTGIEPGHTDCAWCDNTGVHGATSPAPVPPAVPAARDDKALELAGKAYQQINAYAHRDRGYLVSVIQCSIISGMNFANAQRSEGLAREAELNIGFGIMDKFEQGTIAEPAFLSFRGNAGKWSEFREVGGQLKFTGDVDVSECAQIFIDDVVLKYNSKMRELAAERTTLASDYDALAAQRDEGLAREADLRKERDAAVSWQETVREYSPLIAQRDTLQQRLAEATDLLRHMTSSYHHALENGYDRIIFLGGDCDSVAKMEADDPYYAKARAFLASPGCADGEKAQ